MSNYQRFYIMYPELSRRRTNKVNIRIELALYKRKTAIKNVVKRRKL